MLESLRTALLRRSLRHILAAQKRRRHTHTLETARSIGILFDGTEEKDRRAILDFAHSLESPTKKIRLLGFVDVSHPLGQTLFAQFTQKDLGWMGKPKTEAVNTFVHEPLDVLICLNPRQVELVEWVAAASQAAMKIGTYTDLPNDFDLMLETPAEKGPQYFVSQLEIYLKKLSQPIMHLQEQFSGTGVALVTPFKQGAIDWASLEKVIEHVIAGGVEFLVSLGTTGESVTLSEAEQRQVLDFTIKVNRKRLPVVAGVFGGNNTAELVAKIKSFNFDGIDALLSSNPAYNKPGQEGIYRHYMALAEVSPRPIIIYNVPSRTASNMTAETTLRLAHASDKFLGVKEASDDIYQVMQIIKGKPDRFLVLSGDDFITLPLITAGGNGVISVIANTLPRPFSDMVRAALQNDLKTAQQLNLKLLDLYKMLFLEGNPVGVKAALEIQGLCSREVRLPLVPMTDKGAALLGREMGKL